jgi:dTDP-4-dehydrorhamnose reductase
MSTDVLITGGGGMLAYALRRELAGRGVVFHAPTRAELDVTDEAAVHDLVKAVRPRVVIQCAAYTRVDEAESHEEEAFRVNALGTKFAAEAAHQVGARFVFPSTDYVFDGTATRPYKPADEPNPINAYGRTKLAGEEYARLAPDHLIIRLSWLYGPGGRNFVRTIFDRLHRAESVNVVDDQSGSPTWTIDAAATTTALLLRGVDSGLYHWGNAGAATWFDLAVAIAAMTGTVSAVSPCRTDEFPAVAERPRYSILDCSCTESLVGPAREWRTALAEAVNSRAF